VSARTIVVRIVAALVAGFEIASCVSAIAVRERYAKRILWARNSGQIIGAFSERAEGI